MDPGAILWDFDGTLAFREGMWSGTLLEILNAEYPDLDVDRDFLRPFIRDGFPWHRPDIPHPGTSPDEWWAGLEPFFENAFLSAGVPAGSSGMMAGRVRDQYCSSDRWSLFPDTIPVLETLSDGGWKHSILSNHVPELPLIVSALGLDGLLEKIYSSALTGFEKPNRLAFLTVLQGLDPGDTVVMVGDNPEADVRGAMNLGIPAILVRKPAEPDMQYSGDLSGITGILGEARGVRVFNILGIAEEH